MEARHALTISYRPPQRIAPDYAVRVRLYSLKPVVARDPAGFEQNDVDAEVELP